MKITLDRAKCTGLGICESLAPCHFEVDDGGVLLVLKETVSESERGEVEEAVAGCPTEALRLAD
ncbi:ferredoxin [Nocardia bovistercoris]|uniref:Ferredoxin n=1 Tax=Nocardia bovistercoris TaxID=2785916 RepID=A0A931N011_9NOCA|nr:ferredoxin [Nocardia bovistercoris]MBH0776735.1 ferredoxin [Nocardia bovistercoris]